MGFGGDGSHQNDAAEPDFETAGFDENKWFEEKAERLRLQNEQQCLEVRAALSTSLCLSCMRQTCLFSTVAHLKHVKCAHCGTE
jgi:ribosomal protein S27E